MGAVSEKKGKGERKVVESYKIVYEGADGELVEKKSRFIAQIRPVASEEEALAFIEEATEEILGCKAPLLRLYYRRTGSDGPVQR